MAEYIEREEMIGELDELISNISFTSPYQNEIDRMIEGMERARDCVYNAETADVQPVVHGKWIDHMVRDWRCSECGEKIHKVRKVDGYCYNDKPNYCHNCGAKMDLEE